MTLRTSGDHPRRSARRPSSLRLSGACAVLVVVLLGLFAGSSEAGVSDYTGSLYATKTASGIGSGNWQLSTSAPASVDNTTGNRVNTLTTGYALFAPGVSPPLNSAVNAAASAATCTGWIVDNPGSVAFAAGTWTFQATVEDPNNANGQAKLTGALYVVNGSGSVVSTVVSPTDGAATLIRAAPGATTTTVSISGAGSSFSLSSAQHLCLMFWRHQTTQYTSGGGATRLFKLEVNDGTAAITAHPAPDGYPTIALSATPADNSYVNASQTLTLGATYTDPESQAGTVVLQVCPDSACASVQAQNTSNGVASGSSASWSPSLADGTWYWRASGADSFPTTVWTGTDKFILNTTVPSVPALVSPAAGVTTNSLALSATFSDPSVSDTGTVNFRLCTDALCTGVAASGSSSSVTNGSNGSWTISPAPADGSYYWEAQNVDMAGNTSAWSASRAVTFDRTPPTTTIGSKPSAPSTTSNATFSFSASESATFECNLDGAGWGTSCTSPKSYSGLADGSHTFQVRGTDTVGNVGAPASWTWSIDTTFPVTPTLTSPADGTLTNVIPQLGGTFTDPTAGDTGTVQFRLCTSPAAAGVQCSPFSAGGTSASVATGSTGTYTPAALADGTYDWQAKAQDTAGNASGWSATRSFTYDSTPPTTTISSQPANPTNSTNASFSFSSSESPSTSQCSLDGAAFAACTSPATYAGLAQGSHTFQVKSTDQAGNTESPPASYTWTVDTTPPDTTIGPTQPPAVSTSASATFDLGATEPSTYACSLDGSAWSACTTPKTYSGLAEGNHTFQVRATDLAGNTDATPASKTWFIDTSVPSTPSLVAPSDGSATNVLPQFKATFTDPTGTDSGTVEFRICTSPAASGTACAPMVQDVTSAVLPSGGTATYAPAALADGQYYWQARAQDNAGNQSAWSATHSVIYDTGTPLVPVLDTPANGVWLRSVALRAQFSEPAFAGTGSVEFRVCPDALCLAVSATGNTGTLSNGDFATWGASVGDGAYWWQARAHDAAGNQSAWSAVRSFQLDATPPAAPPNFNGQLAADGLTLRWDPPQDTIANFIVYVNGASGPYLGEQTYEYKVGPFDAGDTRTFSVRAVDKAGNFGAMSETLVGVPNLVGLTWDQAQSATHARGLMLRRDASIQHAGTAVIVAQDPQPATLMAEGGSVKVVAKAKSDGTALTIAASPNRVVCAAGTVVKLSVDLSRDAVVRARVLGAKGRVVATRKLGLLHAGTNAVRVRLPRSLGRGASVVLDSPGSTARAVVSVALARHGCSSR